MCIRDRLVPRPNSSSSTRVCLVTWWDSEASWRISYTNDDEEASMASWAGQRARMASGGRSEKEAAGTRAPINANTVSWATICTQVDLPEALGPDSTNRPPLWEGTGYC
eukprot:TRINITY_DN62576_c0_g1_i1.p1 TRINITY_DN62576_c0_g1~~TRINITY_DN62576_c0_g1_i1.p1  ORF type:complete len:109 (+),score=6.17 TRINITY_DN62576_c0_g1_i1:91-417(+)